MHRKFAYVALAGLVLLVGTGVTTWTRFQTRAVPAPASAASTPTTADGADGTDAVDAAPTIPLRRPPSAVAELGVLTKAASPVLDRAALAASLTPAVCGDAPACDAVRATLNDERATTLRLATPAEWGLDPADAGLVVPSGAEKWPTAIVIQVATASTRRQLALRTAFAIAAAVAARANGVVVDRVLERAEDAATFAAHAPTEPLEASVFRADRVRLAEEPAGDGLLRLRTVGLARWGSPDVEAVAVPVVARYALEAVVLGVAAAVADGADSNRVTLSRSDLDAASGRHPADGGTVEPDGEAPRVVVDLVSVASDRPGTPDANDFVARIEPSGGESALGYVELGERFFGSVLGAPPDEASQRTEQTRTAKQLAAAFEPGGAGHGAKVFVRLPFEIPGGGGGHEALWVEVTGHDARTVTGRIDDDPLAATDVERGQEVTRPRADVEAGRVR
jgi:hypothetical protein